MTSWHDSSNVTLRSYHSYHSLHISDISTCDFHAIWYIDVMSYLCWMMTACTCNYTVCKAKKKKTFRTCSFNTILFIYGILNEVVFMQRRETYSQALHYIRWIYIYEMLWEIIKYGQSVAHFSTISICYLFIVSNNAW